MKSKLIIIVSIVLIIMGFYSCEDQLDIEQHGVRDVSNFYKTDEQCLEGLAAIYYQIETSWRNNDFFITASLADDAYPGGGARGNDVNLEEMNEFRHNANNGRVSELFVLYYTTIYRCKMLISRTDIENGSSTQKRCVAEAQVIRAFTYLRLVSFFGEVPLIAEELSGDFARPSASLSEIYSQIELDLNNAIASGALLEKENASSQLVNVSKQLAQAVLGKAYVYESTFTNVDKWTEARQALNAVISSGKYELFEGDYLDIFHYGGRFSTESMFETNRLFDSQNLAMDRSLTRLGWRKDRFKPDQLEVTQSTGLTFCANESYGFMNPTRELYKAFEEMEGEDGYRLNQVMISYKQLNEMPLQIGDGNYVYGNAGYFPLKFMTQASERVARNTYATNYMLFRYAEVLLLAAEAELPEHGGSQAKVDEYVNMIKARAGIANQPGNYTLEDIQKEKRLELCFECTRYPDLVRWGIAAQVLADKGKQVPLLYGLYDGSDNSNQKFTDTDGYNISWYETSGTGFQTKHEFLPIPQEELNVNKQISQHEGW
ncbi:RagB/SusD family nutrient uptake outer membrane protein [Draconibacterium mangrovi]|uniref:RagB/SusD family nutrient uptake outer membrane protein n=1 Tax=Draconibacterium mangrovi TaxID=2697469 RepID=UPI0013D1E539|nr:RagB/SusD family nutrient uptake outer membrane protein [Draconibacterium mangrovi]